MKSVQLAPRDLISDIITKHGINFPVFGSPKIDGLRAAHKMKLLTRSMKDHKNIFLQNRFGPDARLMGMDGELTVGDPWDPEVFQNTDGPCRQVNSTPDASLNIFDRWDLPKMEYWQRLEELQKTFKYALSDHPHIRLVEQRLLNSYEEMDEFECECLELGYEGIMVRDPHGLYKYGRCTAKEANIYKVKRFEHAEAVILRPEELMINKNEPYIAENGMQKRSTKKEGLIPGNTLGAIWVRDTTTGEEFKVGSGFNPKQRAELWARFQSGDDFSEQLLRYKHFPKGRKDAPRHPIFAGFRAPNE